MAAFNVGVGAKYWVADHIAFRIDLRDYMVTEIFQETYHNVGATFGITFAFGGKAKSARAQVAKYEAKPEPEPVTEAKPKPKAEEPVVILVSEPKAEEKVIVLASEPKIEEKVIVLKDVHFDFDKSTLTKEAQVIVKRNIQVLKENPNVKIRIQGHTSAIATEEYNQKLSERRAHSVEEFLIKEGGIAPDKLSTIGYGETRLEKPEPNPEIKESEAAKTNRRVLFEIIVK